LLIAFLTFAISFFLVRWSDGEKQTCIGKPFA